MSSAGTAEGNCSWYEALSFDAQAVLLAIRRRSGLAMVNDPMKYLYVEVNCVCGTKPTGCAANGARQNVLGKTTA